ncbi:hypothetical protein OIU79_012777 [Salix purpurea]|uniref:Uncharacterized protein n=1 Tax=Salix purpurea TaxID=77065 RepID=A0A9Q0Q3Y6_SALPP|nr:hypothetical protein OIU79_012777 [Salix purpurea]
MATRFPWFLEHLDQLGGGDRSGRKVGIIRNMHFEILVSVAGEILQEETSAPTNTACGKDLCNLQGHWHGYALNKFLHSQENFNSQGSLASERFDYSETIYVAEKLVVLNSKNAGRSPSCEMNEKSSHAWKIFMARPCANVKVVSRDDDENSAGRSQYGSMPKTYRPLSYTETRRTSILTSSRHWRAAPNLKSGGYFRTGKCLLYDSASSGNYILFVSNDAVLAS